MFPWCSAFIQNSRQLHCNVQELKMHIYSFSYVMFIYTYVFQSLMYFNTHSHFCVFCFSPPSLLLTVFIPSPERDVALRTFKRILDAGNMPSTCCSWWHFPSATGHQREPTAKLTPEDLHYQKTTVFLKQKTTYESPKNKFKIFCCVYQSKCWNLYISCCCCFFVLFVSVEILYFLFLHPFFIAWKCRKKGFHFLCGLPLPRSQEPRTAWVNTALHTSIEKRCPVVVFFIIIFGLCHHTAWSL